MPGKGFGLVTTRDVDLGERIMSESPVLTLRHGFRENEGDFVLASLTDSERDEIFALHDCRASSPSEKTFMGLFQTNALPLGTNSKGGLFPRIARINHSCVPNLNFYYNDDLEKAEMYAIRSIKAGEELTFSYTGSPLDSTSQRQQYLRQAFAFDCTCDACSLSADLRDVSDTNRSRLKALSIQVKGALRSADDGKFAGEVVPLLDQTHERIRLLREENLDNPMQLLLCHYDAYCLLSKAGQQAEAHVWLERAVMYANQAQGKTSRTSKRLYQLLQNL
jgi:hypothetical protein